MSDVNLNLKVWGKSGNWHLAIFAMIKIVVAPWGLLAGQIDYQKLPKDTSEKVKEQYTDFFYDILSGVIYLVMGAGGFYFFRCRWWFRSWGRTMLYLPVFFAMCTGLAFFVEFFDEHAYMTQHLRKMWPTYKCGVVASYISFCITQIANGCLGYAMITLSEIHPPPPRIVIRKRKIRRKEEEQNEDSDSDRKVAKKSGKTGKSGPLKTGGE